jgi:hypothetical protein
MITVEHLIKAVAEEFRILKHLGTKVTPENKDHKLTDAQRTIQEVEHYIISSLPVQVKLMVLGKRDNDIYNQYTEQFTAFTYTQFADALDGALATIRTDLQSVQPEQWDEEISIWGKTAPRSAFLVDYLLVFLGAYKMQIFLQLKASGVMLDTYNLWAGMDNPQG